MRRLTRTLDLPDMVRVNSAGCISFLVIGSDALF